LTNLGETNGRRLGSEIGFGNFNTVEILYDLNKDNRTVSGSLGGGETTLYTKV